MTDRETTGTKPPRPDRRRVRSRRALIDAGRRLFVDRSADGVSIGEIAEAADLAKGSFYNHFPDKQALADEVIRQIRDHVAELVDAANEGIEDPAIRVARSLCVVLRFGLEHPESASAFFRLLPGNTARDVELTKRAYSFIEDGLKTKIFSNIGLEDGLLLIIGVSSMTLQQALELRSTPQAAQSLAAVLSAGLLRAFSVPADQAASISQQAAQDILGMTSPNQA